MAGPQPAVQDGKILGLRKPTSDLSRSIVKFAVQM
jgi:hypothetical protein